MLMLIAGLVIFLGIHSIRMVAPGYRDTMLARLGEGGWKGTYSLISLAGLVLLIWGYARAQPLAPVLYVTPFGFVHLTATLMALAFIAMMVANLKPGKLKPILKHPFLLSVKIWAFAHLLVNGDLASVILFGAFLAWAVWNRIAVKRRGDPIPEPGPVSNDVIAVVSGLVIWGLFVWVLHEWLIGVPIFVL
ncbi:MAG: NnrU family protein [Pseudomonadota bacterium]|nr:NnrU family protein [Pseudomonadota bacterium]